MKAGGGPLFTDLYELTMLEAYAAEGLADEAVFEVFVRRLPARRGFLMTTNLEPALDELAALRFEADDLEAVRRLGFPEPFLDRLAGLRFTGSVDAMPEGTVFFPDEPILRVTAPLPEAQFVETRLLNLLHFGAVVASKAARLVLAAEGRPLVDFGGRRAHGEEAGVLAARSAYAAGFAGTSLVAAGARYGIPCFGTMAHSFVEVHDAEADAFAAFARGRRRDVTLLVDTYDTEEGARKAAALAPALAAEGIPLDGVRLDSGDLAAHALRVRRILDEAGLRGARIFASGGLDEEAIAQIVATGAPIDAFGVGSSLVTGSDAPALDAAYKLMRYAGAPRRKRSEGKGTWPGAKQVYRTYDAEGRIAADRLVVEGEEPEGVPLLRPVMRNGRRVREEETLGEIRARAARELSTLPEGLRRLGTEPAVPVVVSDEVRRLTREADAVQR